MPRRSEADWESLSPAYRRRVERSSIGRSGWLRGQTLPRKEFGHSRTPSHGAGEALASPEQYGRYIRRNTPKINEQLRSRGETPLAEGPRGRSFARPTYNDPDIPSDRTYTLVVKAKDTGTSNGIPEGYHVGQEAYGNLRNAQDKARESGAPPGAVLIVDMGPRATGGRYMVTWEDYAGTKKRGRYSSNANRTRQRMARRAYRERRAA